MSSFHRYKVINNKNAPVSIILFLSYCMCQQIWRPHAVFSGVRCPFSRNAAWLGCHTPALLPHRWQNVALCAWNPLFEPVLLSPEMYLDVHTQPRECKDWPVFNYWHLILSVCVCVHVCELCNDSVTEITMGGPVVGGSPLLMSANNHLIIVLHYHLER